MKPYSEITDKIENGLNSSKEFIKAQNNLFCDVVSSVESFGKSIMKSARALIGHSSGDVSLFVQNNDFLGRELSITIDEFTKYSNMKLHEISEKVRGIQKQMARSVGNLQQELHTLKTQYSKEFTRRERLIKEVSASIVHKKKTQESHETKYNISLQEKDEINIGSLVKELELSEETCNKVGEKINLTEEKLVDALSDIHQVWQLADKMVIENHFSISIKLLSSLKVSVAESMKIFKDSVIMLRETSEKERVAIFMTFENSPDIGISLMEERMNCIKNFKIFLKEYSSTFDTLAKIISKVSRGSFVEKNVEINFYAKELEALSKYMSNFPLFIEIKIESIENLLKEGKIVKPKTKKYDSEFITQTKAKQLTQENVFMNLLDGLFSQLLIVLQVGHDAIIRSIEKIQEENDQNMSIELIPLSFKPNTKIQTLESFRNSLPVMTDSILEPDDDIKKKSSNDDTNAINEHLKELDIEKASLSKSLSKKFKLTENDLLLYSYSCAFAQKILLQGRLYIFSTKICFHSFFNNKTLFGDTVLIIPMDDVDKVEARVNIIFDNMISIITNDGELNFASFIYRDQALQKLQDLLKRRKKLLSPNSKFSSDNEDSPPNEQIEQEEENKGDPIDETRTESIEKKIFEDSFKYSNENSYIFNDYNITEVIDRLYSIKSLEYKGKDYNSYLDLFLLSNDSTVEEMDNWHPKVDFSKLPIGDYNFIAKFVRKIKDKPIFSPSTVTVIDKYMVHILSSTEVYIELVSKLEKIPYCDCFFIKYGYKYSQNDKNVELSFKYGIEFVKSTIFKGKIQTDSLAEIQRVWNQIQVPLFDYIFPPKITILNSTIENSSDKQTRIPSYSFDSKIVDLLKESNEKQEKSMVEMQKTMETLKLLLFFIFLAVCGNLLFLVSLNKSK